MTKEGKERTNRSSFTAYDALLYLIAELTLRTYTDTRTTLEDALCGDLKVLQRVHPPILEGAQVVLVGDGEFDGINLQAVVNNRQRHHARRAASNITHCWEDEPFVFRDMSGHTAPGEIFMAPGCKFTQKKYGPVLTLCRWRQECKRRVPSFPTRPLHFWGRDR